MCPKQLKYWHLALRGYQKYTVMGRYLEHSTNDVFNVYICWMLLLFHKGSFPLLCTSTAWPALVFMPEIPQEFHCLALRLLMFKKEGQFRLNTLWEVTTQEHKYLLINLLWNNLDNNLTLFWHLSTGDVPFLPPYFCLIILVLSAAYITTNSWPSPFLALPSRLLLSPLFLAGRLFFFPFLNLHRQVLPLVVGMALQSSCIRLSQIPLFQ